MTLGACEHRKAETLVVFADAMSTALNRVSVSQRRMDLFAISVQAHVPTVFWVAEAHAVMAQSVSRAESVRRAQKAGFRLARNPYVYIYIYIPKL